MVIVVMKHQILYKRQACWMNRIMFLHLTNLHFSNRSEVKAYYSKQQGKVTGP